MNHIIRISCQDSNLEKRITQYEQLSRLLSNEGRRAMMKETLRYVNQYCRQNGIKPAPYQIYLIARFGNYGE